MSKLKSKVVHINNHRTSIRLCHSEWLALEDMCRRENISRKMLIETIEQHRNGALGLTGSLRLLSIAYYHDIAKNNADVKSTPIRQLLNKLF